MSQRGNRYNNTKHPTECLPDDLVTLYFKFEAASGNNQANVVADWIANDRIFSGGTGLYNIEPLVRCKEVLSAWAVGSGAQGGFLRVEPDNLSSTSGNVVLRHIVGTNLTNVTAGQFVYGAIRVRITGRRS